MEGFEEFEDFEGSGGFENFEGFGGYAGATDPRESYDDLLTDSSRDVHEHESYREHAEMEAFQSGWVAAGIVRDDADRVLLAYDADSEVWVLPGGTLQRGETLHDGLVREVREETGIDVEPDRPRGLTEYRVEHATNDETWTGFRVAFVEAIAADTTIGDDLGVADETFTDVDWFHDLPEDVLNAEFTRRVVAATRDD